MWSVLFLQFAVVLLFVGIFSVCAYGWLPFLIYGVARRRRGEGGKWQLAVAGVWVVWLAAFMLWSFLQMRLSPHIPSPFILLLLYLLLPFLLSAWIPLLIWGIARRRRKKKGGVWMTAVGGVWCLLLVSFMTYGIVKVSRINANFAWQRFDPGAYTGAVAAVEFPYTGEGNINLSVFPVESPPFAWSVHAVDTNRMVIPAGEYERATLRVQLKGGLFDFRFDTPFTVAQDEVFTFSGGFPLVASIDVEKQGDDRLSLEFSLIDSAGNEVMYRGRGEIGFEALSPDGVQVWRGDFEWG